MNHTLIRHQADSTTRIKRLEESLYNYENGCFVYLAEVIVPVDAVAEDVISLNDLKDAPDKLDDAQVEVHDPLIEVNLGTRRNPLPMFVGGLLTPQVQAELIGLLKEFADCFAWDYHELPGLDRSLVEHRLPSKEGFQPHKQPLRRMTAEVTLTIKVEIERLLKAGFVELLIVHILTPIHHSLCKVFIN